MSTESDRLRQKAHEALDEAIRYAESAASEYEHGSRIGDREALESKREAHAAIDAIPEQRGHARNCKCCYAHEYDSCHRDHPYRDPRCAEPPQESVEEVARWLQTIEAEWNTRGRPTIFHEFTARAVLAKYGRKP